MFVYNYFQVWAVFISMLIVISTLTEAMASLPVFNVNYTEYERKALKHVAEFLKWDDSLYEQMTMMKPHSYLELIDIFCHSIITLEFIASFLVCPNKATYVSSLARIFTMIGYVSFWLDLLMLSQEVLLQSITAIKVISVLSYLTILKLSRLFYLANRIPAFSVIGLTLSSSKTELKILTVILAILVCMFGFSIYFAEYANSKITNVFLGMYWALITVTTVGYGDYTPETPAGYVIASACACCGVLFVALPIGIIASSFYTFYNYHKYGMRHYDHYKVCQN